MKNRTRSFCKFSYQEFSVQECQVRGFRTVVGVQTVNKGEGEYWFSRDVLLLSVDKYHKSMILSQ